MHRFNIIFLLLTILSNVLLRNVEGIVGGNMAKINQFKYQVSVQIDNTHVCGGGIIGNQIVLTAAHCIVNEQNMFETYQFSVVAGVIDLLTNPSSYTRITVAKAYVPIEYDRSNGKTTTHRETGDIAVLRLSKEFVFGSNSPINKLLLPKPHYTIETYVNNKPIVTGFGVENISYRRNSLTKGKEIVEIDSYKLKFAETFIFVNQVCSKRYALKKPLSDSHLCGQIRQRNQMSPEGLCIGDSGGPLVIRRNILIGIVSAGPVNCNEIESPSVYIKVAHFLPFIQNAIDDINAPDIRSHIYK